jgi:ABC-type glycerol-3-phosphate transport system permease component
MISSITPAAELFSATLRILPSRLTLEHYLNLTKARPILSSFLNSLKVAGITSGLSILISIFACFGFRSFTFWGKKTLWSLILFSYLFPGVLIIIPLYFLMFNLGLLNTHSGLVLAHSSFVLPLAVYLLSSFFRTIPVEIGDAALTDGCSKMGTLFRITIPLSLPGFLTVGLFGFILSWNNYLFAMILLNRSSKYTLPLLIAQTIQPDQIFWGDLLTLSVVTCLPVIVIFGFINRHFVKGLTAGALR